jgi:hypothetical protein
MNTKKPIDDGGAAFPTRSPFICAVHPDGGIRHINTDEYGMGPLPGMSLRDYFAGQALQAWATTFPPGARWPENYNELLYWASRFYQVADAMLAARKAAIETNSKEKP